MKEKVPVFELTGVTVGYNKVAVLNGINLNVLPGSWVTVLGPNGAGKTTLLKTLLGILKPLHGVVRSSTRSFGYVPQSMQCPRVFPLTTAEFLMLNPNGGDPLETERWVKRLGLESVLGHPLSQLSGGLFKRTQLVFALMSSPEVLFLDEYLEGLDPISKREAEEIMTELNQKYGKTVVEVSHDLTSVTKSVKRILFINGRITYDGPPSGQGFHSCLHQSYGEEAVLREDSK